MLDGNGLRLDWAGLGWMAWDCIEWDGIGLDGIGMDWIARVGFDWVGLGWVGLHGSDWIPAWFPANPINGSNIYHHDTRLEHRDRELPITFSS